MAKRTKQDSDRTCQALLDAASVVFIRRGVAKTTLSDIASEAGVSRGAVYWHFANKDEVIRVFWERTAGELHQTFLEQLAQIKGSERPDLSFRQAVGSLLHSLASRPGLCQAIRIVMHCVEFTDEQTELQRFLRSRRNELHGALQRAFLHLESRGMLQVGMPPKQLTQSLMSYLYGLVHYYLEPGHHPLDLTRNGEAMLDLMLNGILVPPDQIRETDVPGRHT